MGRAARLLTELTAAEVGELVSDSSVIVQPIGAVEQHGPHLPLATDAIIAEAAAGEAVRSQPQLDCWLLPTLVYGNSGEHTWAPGTVSLSPSTLLAVLADVGASVARMGARRLLLLNGHGGNTALLKVACRELRRDHGLLTFLAHPTVPPDHGGPPGDPSELGLGIHGGIGETSTVLHLRPDLVHMDRAAANVPAWIRDNEHVSFGGSVAFGWVSSDFGPSGVIGDPTRATVETGKERFETAVTHLGKALIEIAAFDFPDAAPPADPT